MLINLRKGRLVGEKCYLTDFTISDRRMIVAIDKIQKVLFEIAECESLR